MKDDVAAALGDMLGPAVGIGLTDPRDAMDDLLPSERAAVAGAIAKRRNEFAAGRRAARQAMSALGLPAAAVPIGYQRAPIWPSGLTGSIAHCDTICIAAVSQTHSSVGVDIEPATPLATDLIEIVCTETEKTWLNGQPRSVQEINCKLLFCAKEAIYKAQYPLTGQVIGFDALSVRIGGHGKYDVNWHQPMPNLPRLSGTVRTLQQFILAVALT